MTDASQSQPPEAAARCDKRSLSQLVSPYVLPAGCVALLVSASLLGLAVKRKLAQPVTPQLALIEAPQASDSKGAQNTQPTPTPPELISATTTLQDQLKATERLKDAGPALDNPALDRFAATETVRAAPPTTTIVPPEKRWQIYFADKLTVGTYAEQLDALEIELGVVVGDGSIQYASKVSQADPVARTAPASDEARLYLSWSRGDLVEADRQLLGIAKIDSADKIVLHFCSEATIQKLTDLERKFQDRLPEQIERTRFGIKPSGGRYDFYVRDQQVREADTN